jgi:GNAT superfamily N-acetyltransferase
VTATDLPAPPLTLRPLSAADAPALQAVYAAAADYFLRASSALPQAAAELQQAAGEEGRFLLGIYLSGEMIGLLDLRLAYPGPYDVSVGLILLAEGQRRQGLGSWALRILEAWLRRDTPTEAVIISVPAQDHVAQGFFLAHEYTFTGQSTRVLIGSARPRLLEMRKSLVEPAASRTAQ